MNNDLVSIIIPTLNEAANIKKCLQSCQKQSYKNIEIIVVDNFSKDNTLQIAKKYTKKCLLHGNERSQQRNFGAQKARGKYLLFLDADMQLTKNCLLEALNKIKEKNRIIAFSEISKGQNFWEKSIALERSLYQKEQILLGARLFPKDLFIKLKGFDKTLIAGEDWDLTIRAQKLNCKLVIAHAAIIHTENVKNLKEFIKKKSYYAKNILLYAKKHPQEFKKQSNLKNRLGIYLRNLPILLKDSTHTLGFLFLKTLVWYDWQNIKNEKNHS
jgi:glycosyltransferase involved in cell wall biosynthesis